MNGSWSRWRELKFKNRTLGVHSQDPRWSVHWDIETRGLNSAKSQLPGLYCGLGWLDHGHLLPLGFVDSFIEARFWFKDQFRMLQRAQIMWKNNLVIQWLTDEMEFAVTYSIPEDFFGQELWISKVPGATGLLTLQTLPCEYLKLNPRFRAL